MRISDWSSDVCSSDLAWRERMRAHGVWANDPVPLYPYPGSPDYRKLWGVPDDHAWERAHEHYLRQFDAFSDIQEQRPLPLERLERRRSEEHTSELQSLMRISYAVLCLKKKKNANTSKTKEYES